VSGRFDLAIFDLDGVLVDSEPISSRITVAALAEAGIALGAAELAARFLGISPAAMLQTLEAEHGRRLPAGFAERLQARILAAFEQELAPIAGVEAVLADLPLPCCVASSSAPARIWRSLALTGLLARFAPHLFSAAMVARGKPAPDLFLLAAARLAAAPARCLVIEDSPAGVRAGKAAGMTVLGFAGGSHVEPAAHGRILAAAGADEVATAMPALAAFIAAA
jgi:HAD superfamily hydrolase (TIGR01509 family)